MRLWQGVTVTAASFLGSLALPVYSSGKGPRFISIGSLAIVLDCRQYHRTNGAACSAGEAPIEHGIAESSRCEAIAAEVVGSWVGDTVFIFNYLLFMQ